MINGYQINDWQTYSTVKIFSQYFKTTFLCMYPTLVHNQKNTITFGTNNGVGEVQRKFKEHISL